MSLLPNGKIIQRNDNLYYNNPILRLLTQTDLSNINNTINNMEANIINNHIIFGNRGVYIGSENENITISYESAKYMIIYLSPESQTSSITQTLQLLINGISSSYNSYYAILNEGVNVGFHQQYYIGTHIASFTESNLQLTIWSNLQTDRYFFLNYIIFT